MKRVRVVSRGTGGHGMPEGLRRVLWFVGLWAAGVLAVGAVGLLIRWALRGAG